MWISPVSIGALFSTAGEAADIDQALRVKGEMTGERSGAEIWVIREKLCVIPAQILRPQ